MTPDELHDAIVADPAAKALADAGNDAGCAALISLPPLVVPHSVTELGIYAAFASEPATAETILQTLESVAASQHPAAPLVRRMLAWIKPGAPGVDFGNAGLRTMLDQFAAGGNLKLEWVATLKALAERPQTVSASEVSAAWARYRPEGKVQ